MNKIFSLLMLIALFLSVKAQKSDTLKTENKKVEFQAKKLYVPLGLMVAGVAIDGNGQSSIKNQVKDWRNRQMPNFRTHADDFLQFAPLAAAYAFEWAGMTPRTDFKNRTAIVVKSQIFLLGTTYILKKSLNETRPDGTQYSFPSGHTAEAFAGATLLATEYGENYKWVPYVAYGTATTVGALRIANNRHYISDVLFGAGLGILSTKIAYWTHQYKWNKTPSTKDPLTEIYKESLEKKDEQSIGNHQKVGENLYF